MLPINVVAVFMSISINPLFILLYHNFPVLSEIYSYFVKFILHFMYKYEIIKMLDKYDKTTKNTNFEEEKVMKTITRTIPTSQIYASIVEFADGEVKATDLSVIEVVGEEVKKDAAMKIVSKKYGKDYTYIIRSVEVQQDVYEITLDDFLKNAKKLPEKTSDPAPIA